MSEKDQDQETEGEGFVIKDKRSAYLSDEESQDQEKEVEKEAKKDQERQASAEQQAEQPFEINFSTFVLSLTSSAFYYLGDMPDPTTGQVMENLPAVKQTIDILIMLKEKTQNNLDAEESKLIEQLIYELQMKYVAKQKGQQ